jgi:hypothetical protein
VQSGTALARTGWVASTNAPSSALDAPANALDGNWSTQFSTDVPQSVGLYFEVNMGSAQSFNELAMETPGSTNDYARGYDIYVSNTGGSGSWTEVAACTGAGTPEIVSFSPQDAQYVQVDLTTANTNPWSIDEFNLFSQSTGS